MALWAAGLAVFVMAFFYWEFPASGFGDWLGYAEIWDQDGGWLANQGRDPLFVTIVHQSRQVFGDGGYAVFRDVLYGVFTLAAARFAYVMRSRQVSALYVVPIVAAALLVKSLVQIREGMAFVIAVVPLVGVFRASRSGWLVAGIGALMAVLMHFGALLFVVCWAVASVLYLAPDRLLGGKGARTSLMALGLALGVAMSVAILAFSKVLELALEDLGSDTTAPAIGGAWKYVYWIVNGGLVLLVRQQLLNAAWGSRKFGYAYATVLGSVVLPIIYTVCIILVFNQFYLPVITSAAVRLLFSGVEAALLVIGFRGKANWLTAAIAVILIADQLRLLLSESAAPLPA